MNGRQLKANLALLLPCGCVLTVWWCLRTLQPLSQQYSIRLCPELAHRNPSITNRSNLGRYSQNKVELLPTAVQVSMWSHICIFVYLFLHCTFCRLDRRFARVAHVAAGWVAFRGLGWRPNHAKKSATDLYHRFIPQIYTTYLYHIIIPQIYTTELKHKIQDFIGLWLWVKWPSMSDFAWTACFLLRL